MIAGYFFVTLFYLHILYIFINVFKICFLLVFYNNKCFITKIFDIIIKLINIYNKAYFNKI